MTTVCVVAAAAGTADSTAAAMRNASPVMTARRRVREICQALSLVVTLLAHLGLQALRMLEVDCGLEAKRLFRGILEPAVVCRVPFQYLEPPLRVDGRASSFRGFAMVSGSGLERHAKILPARNTR